MKKRSLMSFLTVGLFISRSVCAETIIQSLMAGKIAEAVENMSFSSVTLLMVIGAAFLAFSLLNMGSTIGEALGGATEFFGTRVEKQGSVDRQRAKRNYEVVHYGAEYTQGR